MTGQPLGAIATFVFFYVGGMGVRERSWFAALLIFVAYATDLLLSPGIVRIFLSALLFSNLRATWIASHWKPDSEEAATFPPRFNDTLGDKLADQWPMRLWPKLRIPYFVLAPVAAGDCGSGADSGGEGAIRVAGSSTPLSRKGRD